MIKEEIEKLIELQKVDEEIREIENEISSFPVLKNQLQEQLDKELNELNFIKEEHKKLQVERREKELELQALEEEVKKLKNRLNEVKTNKEYNSILAEIENLKKKISDTEDEILILMERNDEIAKKQEDFRKKSEMMKKEFERKIEEKRKRIEELKKELEGKLQEREKIAEKIDKEIYSLYEKIRKNKKDGIAICKLEGETCTGCFMHVPTYIEEKVKRKKEIVQCENCSRILY